MRVMHHSLGDWKDHGENTGGFYACNKYTAKEEDVDSAEARRRQRAKESLERYTHYFERWANHDSAHRKALKDMHSITDERLRQLGEVYGIPPSQLRFIVDALKQVAECRRVLKFTYAYAYYFMTEETEKQKNDKEFFEFIQGYAEAQLEKLNEAAEAELKEHMECPKEARRSFGDFRFNLTSLTDVAGKHFDKLVQTVESMPQQLSAADEEGEESS